jgi:hypothetical protein
MDMATAAYLRVSTAQQSIDQQHDASAVEAASVLWAEVCTAR